MTGQVDRAALAGHLEALANAALLAVQDLRMGLADLGPDAPSATVKPVAVANDLLDANELAALLKIDIRTLRRWRIEGRVPKPLRGKGPLRWRRSDVEKWLKERGS
jgi:predicted DNA-binding transcriptional regulator AlpA